MRAVLVSLLALGFATSVRAAPQDAAAEARAAEEALDYDIATDLWMTVISDPATDDELKLEAHLRAGLLQRIRGNDTAARLHFRYVLARDPDHQLPPDTTPKVTGFFELVREEVRMEQRALRNRPPSYDAGARAAPTEEPELPLLAWIAVGTGAVLLVGGLGAAGGGAAFGGLALDAHDRAEGEPVQVAAADAYRERDGAAFTANVLFGVGGGAALLGGLVLAVGLGGLL